MVGFGDVGGDVAVRTLRVREDGLDEGVVGGVGDVDGFLAVGIRLEGVDGVGDDGVGGQVLGRGVLVLCDADTGGGRGKATLVRRGEGVELE